METNSKFRNIKFYYLVPGFRFNRRLAVKSFLANIFALEHVQFESLTFIFCTDEYLLEINKAYLSHDYYTDIITFNLSSGSLVAGELYISVDRVRENALDLNVPFQLELLRVIFHGVLHLCGFQDSTPEQKSKMRHAEDKYLEMFALT